ncbi:hypothetical protein [Bacteroides thetaiotaomicron]|uniref:hypothetical protein n=1 Tax=Bacteroides thetaiotaomicron TaxID=818 RepID=UPI0035683ECB
MKEVFFMVYAEGQGAPTFKHEDESKATTEAERLAEKLGVETTVLQAVKSVAPKDITKRVKTYADACAVLGIEPINEEVFTKLGFTKDEIAYRKLKTVVEALNEGWRPDWSDSSDYKYWNWFVYNPSYAGFGYAYTSCTPSSTYTGVGSLLCFKTRELAAYAGRQFEDLYNDFFLIK